MAERPSPPSDESFEQVAERFEHNYRTLVGALIARLGCGADEAEDAVQTAFLRLLESPLDERDHNVGGWLYTVAKHELFRHLRERLRTTLDEAPDPEAESDIVDQLEARRILRLLSRLKPSQQECLRLRALGYSYREVCAHTGQSYTWVNRHTAEGRAALRELADCA